MNLKLIPLVSIVFLSVFWGCKKQELNSESDSQRSSVITTIKDWLGKQSSSPSSQTFFLNDKVFVTPQQIVWDQTIYFDEARTSITPVSLVSITGNIERYKYLVTELNEMGEIKKGNYYVVLSKTTSVQNVTPDLLSLKMVPINFNGTILKYDLNDKVISATTFIDGEKTDNADKIAVKKSKTQIPVENNAPLEEGCSYVTIDWYWQTWENGVLVSEEYLFSTTEIVCNGGGGGGGNGHIDSVATLSAVSEELSGIHDGEFYIFTPKTFSVPKYTSSTAPISQNYTWPVVNAEYYKVNAKTLATAYYSPNGSIIPRIHVSECNNYSSLFEMKKSSMFWTVTWEQASLSPGIIRMNDTDMPESESEVGGYIHIAARSSWWAFMNSMPTITSESKLLIFYRMAPNQF